MFKMKAKKIYLEGGGKHEERTFEDLEKEVLSSTRNKIIFELDFARYGDKILTRKKRDRNYFIGLGAEEINFASDCNSFDEIKERISQSDILYIAGGDTELLLKKIKEDGLDKLIRNFKGILIGNGAGAYACCKEYIKIREDVVQVIPSLGLVNFCCKAHYEDKFDETLKKYSKDRDIYAISEDSVIIIEDDNLKFIGKAYLFSNGKKIRKK